MHKCIIQAVLGTIQFLYCTTSFSNEAYCNYNTVCPLVFCIMHRLQLQLHLPQNNATDCVWKSSDQSRSAIYSGCQDMPSVLSYIDRYYCRTDWGGGLPPPLGLLTESEMSDAQTCQTSVPEHTQSLKLLTLYNPQKL